jgi:hypothetical protein
MRRFEQSGRVGVHHRDPTQGDGTEHDAGDQCAAPEYFSQLLLVSRMASAHR